MVNDQIPKGNTKFQLITLNSELVNACYAVMQLRSYVVFKSSVSGLPPPVPGTVYRRISLGGLSTAYCPLPTAYCRLPTNSKLINQKFPDFRLRTSVFYHHPKLDNHITASPNHSLLKFKLYPKQVFNF